LLGKLQRSRSFPVYQCSVVAVCFKIDETEKKGCVEQSAHCWEGNCSWLEARTLIQKLKDNVFVARKLIFRKFIKCYILAKILIKENIIKRFKYANIYIVEYFSFLNCAHRYTKEMGHRMPHPCTNFQKTCKWK
jgi:hypothetical protein